jgi:mannose-6-phosphate isomerase-like protein (cupin superfamily)
MAKYSITNFGTMADVAKTEYGKAFLHDALNLTSAEISVSVMPAGAKSPFNHIHKQNEEIYIFLSGNGKFMVDDEIFDIKSGTAVRVATGAKRAMENTGTTEMQYICIQAKENSLTQFAFADAEIC